MTPELEKKIEEAADADFIVGKIRPVGTRERYLYEEKRESFLNGASFGRKGMYTEEEVKQLFKNFRHDFSLYRCIQIMDKDFEQWFEIHGRVKQLPALTQE